MTKTTRLTERDLVQFTGSENWYRHGINRNVLLTDGAKYVADEGGAYIPTARQRWSARTAITTSCTRSSLNSPTSPSTRSRCGSPTTSSICQTSIDAIAALARPPWLSFDRVGSRLQGAELGALRDAPARLPGHRA